MLKLVNILLLLCFKYRYCLLRQILKVNLVPACAPQQKIIGNTLVKKFGGFIKFDEYLITFFLCRYFDKQIHYNTLSGILLNFKIMASYFTWTEAKKYDLVSLVQKENGHIKSDESYKVKWDKILAKLKEKAGFLELCIQSAALKNTFLLHCKSGCKSMTSRDVRP